MGLTFTKMHGLGNDYVYIDTHAQRVEDPAALARAMSDRHRGVGADGLIMVAPPDDPSAHVRMIMHNADGSRAQMCGNGIRCVAKYAYDHGLARENPLRVQTDAGILTLELTLGDAGRVTSVRVDMGRPVLEPAEIPVMLEGERAVGVPIEAAGVTFAVTCVSMGNPHAVIFGDELAGVPLMKWGPALETHPLFPERVNVHFVRVVSRDRVEMVSWERGTGATLACGTGASAVCVAGVLNFLTERKLTARVPGGDLAVEWDAQTEHVFMTGPAEEVFRGEWLADDGG